MTKSSKNLSESLFNRHQHGKETSSLIGYLSDSLALLEQTQLRQPVSWYRALKPVQWIWQGIDPIEYNTVLSRIASSGNAPYNPDWLDTIAGYRPGNWAYEWTVQGGIHQKRAQLLNGEARADALFQASLCFSLASYPHLKGDNLSLQAQTLANKSYLEAAQYSGHIVKTLSIPYQNRQFDAYLHLPHTERPLPVVIVCAGIDGLQTEMWRLYRDYFAEHEIAMLTVDMPGLGASSHWNLTENSSCLHKAVLDELVNIPWVDAYHVALLGFRMGGNILTRLAFLEPDKIKACVTLGAPIHQALVDFDSLAQMPKMYIDTIASRIGKRNVDIVSFTQQLRAWSLKSQGVLASRKTNVPILALGLSGDPVGCKQDNQVVAMFSQGGKAIQLDSRSVHQGYEQGLKMSVDWIKQALLD